MNTSSDAVALVTGAARRLGAYTARQLHAHGYNVAIHCHESEDVANQLALELNAQRERSATVIKSKLGRRAQAEHIVEKIVMHWGRLDVVVNNASSFFPTPMGEITDNQVDNLLSSNLTAPLFVSQAAAPHLKYVKGCIINMTDIHGFNPLLEHPVYCAAKSGLVMLTRSLALELAPDIRVNGIAPGIILWPEGDDAPDENRAAKLIDQIPLQSQGSMDDIANAILFLANASAKYITGQIITVDGGKSLR